MKTKIALTLLIVFAFSVAIANTNNKSGFDIVALGTQGGVNTHDLSAFLISPHSQPVSVACDAGSLTTGINSAIEAGSLSHSLLPENYPYSLLGFVLKEHIKGYLISHAHLDHVAGLIIGSVDDTKKPIYGLSSTINALKRDYFNWKVWPNFASSGINPALNKYTYVELQPYKNLPLLDIPMSVKAFPLSHNGIESTAFVLKYQSDIVVCLGDTGPDSVEKSDKLEALWKYIKPYAEAKQLKAIIIESSFPNSRPDNLLFGHLTPNYVIEELSVLADLMKDPNKLIGLPVIISHIKPSLRKGNNVKVIIEQELKANNSLKVNFIIPTQGESWHFK